VDWQVVFSLRSREDLRRIVEYIAKDDARSAERFGLALIAQAEALCQYAARWRANVRETGRPFFSVWFLSDHLPR
jgi:plasmid stabilization system protein ParE